MAFSYSWHRLIAGVSHTRRLYGSGLSSVHAAASRPVVQGLRPAYRLLHVLWLLCSSLTVAVRHSFSFAVRARQLCSTSEPSLVEPICQGAICRSPATSVTFLKVKRVEDASDIELPQKTPTGPSWSTAHCIWVLLDAYPALVPISIGLLCHIYWPLRRFKYWPLCRFEYWPSADLSPPGLPVPRFRPSLSATRKRTLYCRLRPATSVCLFRRSSVEDANRY